MQSNISVISANIEARIGRRKRDTGEAVIGVKETQLQRNHFETRLKPTRMKRALRSYLSLELHFNELDQKTRAFCFSVSMLVETRARVGERVSVESTPLVG